MSAYRTSPQSLDPVSTIERAPKVPWGRALGWLGLTHVLALLLSASVALGMCATAHPEPAAVFLPHLFVWTLSSVAASSAPLAWAWLLGTLLLPAGLLLRGPRRLRGTIALVVVALSLQHAALVTALDTALGLRLPWSLSLPSWAGPCKLERRSAGGDARPRLFRPTTSYSCQSPVE